MRSNGRDPIYLSTLKPSQYRNVGRKCRIVCPDCGTWQGTKQAVIFTHDLEGGYDKSLPSCPGSGTPVRRDVSPDEAESRYREAVADLSRCTVPRQQESVGKPPAPRAVCQIAAS